MITKLFKCIITKRAYPNDDTNHCDPCQFKKILGDLFFAFTDVQFYWT